MRGDAEAAPGTGGEQGGEVEAPRVEAQWQIPEKIHTTVRLKEVRCIRLGLEFQADTGGVCAAPWWIQGDSFSETARQ